MKQKSITERSLYGRRLKTAMLGLCLVLVLLLGISVTTALMFSSTNGFNTSSIATFAVDAGNTTPGSLALNCNTGALTAEYEFWVTNMKDSLISEVSIGYTIHVNLPSPLPEGLTMEVDGIAGTVSADGLTYTYENNTEWNFKNGIGKTRNHTLTFIADSGLISTNINLAGISVSVVAEQID